MTIRHVVCWRFVGDDETARRANAEEVVRRLRGLVGSVPSIQSLTAGVNDYFDDVNGDASLVADFATIEDLEAYQVHPAHQEVASFVRSIAVERLSVDFDLPSQ